MHPQKTFRQVYIITSLPLRKFISKKLGRDQQLVDDIFQETMLAAYKGWDGFEHKSKYLTWMCRIALNKIADYYRRNIHNGSRIVVPIIDDLDSLLVTQLTPEEEMYTLEIRNRVLACMELLPDEYKNVLKLRYFKHYSYQKIASIIGGSERSIEGKIYRAKKSLKDILSTYREKQVFATVESRNS
ncbi:sigma-70 family RNA polymerase sigma factor [candidate division WWE3 bacterium]|uniref:Sigma-70 family RNA polymerase sigma factor n=1 Tax=candidate division WWE3 bacterium TaxID=2053526 RepID=A0A955LH67_UNCKA|nr:sigma-70 family RNA polymerase sigma factor [candidate division WWE3 bacterium]